MGVNGVQDEFDSRTRFSAKNRPIPNKYNLRQKELLQVDVQYLHSYQIFSRKSRLKRIKIMKKTMTCIG